MEIWPCPLVSSQGSAKGMKCILDSIKFVIIVSVTHYNYLFKLNDE